MIKMTKISNQISLCTNLTKVQKLQSGVRTLGVNLLLQSTMASQCHRLSVHSSTAAFFLNPNFTLLFLSWLIALIRFFVGGLNSI